MTDRILTIAVKPITGTDLFWEAKLGGGNYGRYIDELQEKGLLETLSDGKLHTTDKGKAWLCAYKRLQKLGEVSKNV